MPLDREAFIMHCVDNVTNQSHFLAHHLPGEVRGQPTNQSDAAKQPISQTRIRLVRRLAIGQTRKSYQLVRRDNQG